MGGVLASSSQPLAHSCCHLPTNNSLMIIHGAQYQEGKYSISVKQLKHTLSVHKYLSLDTSNFIHLSDKYFRTERV